MVLSKAGARVGGLRCGVLAPNAKLRQAVIESAGPSGATLQVLQEAQQKMGLEEAVTEPASGGRFRKTAARCWAMLLARHRFSGIA